MTTTWTTNGTKHIATKGNLIIGHVSEKLCKTNEPFLAVSMNDRVKDFLILQHAKDWVEDCAFGIDEADFE